MMRMMNTFYWGRFTSTTRQLGSSRSGHAGMMFAVLAMPLLLAIGFVMDMAQTNRYRSELQSVADAVALSAVRGLPISDVQGQLDGRAMYESLMSSIRAGLLTDDVTITFEKLPEFKAFVVINATAPSFFGNGIGIGPIRYEVNAQAILGAIQTEVAMVVDLSASMVTSRIRALGYAMAAFDKTIMETAAAMASLKISVVPFAQTVTLPPYAANWLNDPSQVIAASTMPGVCFAANNSATDISLTTPNGLGLKLIANPARCMSEQVFALTDSFSQYRAMANAFKNPPAWRATWRGQEAGPYWGTAIYLGTSWANRMLSPDWASFLPSSSAPRLRNKSSKFAIIMTDGEQVGLDAYSQAQADAMLLSTCNTMRTNGIEVFTVGFEVNTASKGLLARCAGKTENFISASGDAELKAAFERIGRKVGEALPRLVF